MGAIKWLLDAYCRLLKLLLTVLMGFLVVPVALQILSRYTGLIPRYIWTDEVARFCFIWVIMIGSMIAVREGTHFHVDMLPVSKTEHGKAIGRLVVHVCMLLLALVLLIYGYPFSKFALAQSSMIAELPMIFIFIAWPLAGLTSTLFLGEKIIQDVNRLRAKD